MAPATSAGKALAVLSYAYPTSVLVYYLTSSLLSVCLLQAPKQTSTAKDAHGAPSRRSTLVLLGALVATYIIQLVSLAIYSITATTQYLEEYIVVGSLSCVLIFGIQVNTVFEAKWRTSIPLYGSWILSLGFEATILSLTSLSLSPSRATGRDVLCLVLMSLRCAALLTLNTWTAFGYLKAAKRSSTDEERQSLLPEQGQNGDGPAYGAAQQERESATNTIEYHYERFQREGSEAMESRLQQSGNWFSYVKGFSILLPYLWPFGNIRLQLRAIGVALCLLSTNALNLLIPRQTGIIVDSLSNPGSVNPWIAVLTFAILRILVSDSAIGLLRQWLWMPIGYFGQEAISTVAYSRIMHLSADFHDSKSTPDMLTAIHAGTSISNAVETIILHTVPMLIDMFTAVIYLSITFGPYEGLVTIVTGLVFLLWASKLVGESKASSRKRLHAIFEEASVRHAGLMGWQTASVFNQIGYEDNRHANAVANRWLQEKEYLQWWLISFGFQVLILTCGLVLSAFLAVYRIRQGSATPGSFTMLLMYWAQLTAPLKFFAGLGKSMSDNFINAERILEIMKSTPSVQNKKNAKPLKFVSGEVKFDQIKFSYDKRKQVIRDMTMDVPGGTTIAFVGATGAGKSTILKLLNRFYDVTGGSILIDGQDVRDVDLFSLRDRIGVVPQTPILFDDTIMNNVRYARITATDDEVYQACEAACIHDKIRDFTNGYNTMVGERGIKLSGGELQRVAIARAFLKKPDIVLLDEATSAVDTDTEQKIHSSLRSLCQGRTTFIVAHRLSTIINADRIVVLENGRIIETGHHNELIHANARYADLWSKQVATPTTTEDRNAMANESDKIIVNDLSPDQTTQELRKLGSTRQRPTKRDKEDDQELEEQRTLATEVRTPRKLLCRFTILMWQCRLRSSTP